MLCSCAKQSEIASVHVAQALILLGTQVAKGRHIGWLDRTVQQYRSAMVAAYRYERERMLKVGEQCPFSLFRGNLHVFRVSSILLSCNLLGHWLSLAASV